MSHLPVAPGFATAGTSSSNSTRSHRSYLLLNDEPEYEEALHFPGSGKGQPPQFLDLTRVQEDSHAHATLETREDPDCEYFDLTALSSEDLVAHGSVVTSGGSVGHYTVSSAAATARDRPSLLGRPHHRVDNEQGHHAADHFDLTVLSDEEEDAFDRVFHVVSHVKHSRSASPLPADIVDLTATKSREESHHRHHRPVKILDLTSLGLLDDDDILDDDEQLTENGSVILDLTDFDDEDDLPSLLGAHVRSYDSQNSTGSGSTRHSYLNARNLDWMTQPGPTVASSPGGSRASSPKGVRWHSPVIQGPTQTSKSGEDPDGFVKHNPRDSPPVDNNNNNNNKRKADNKASLMDESSEESDDEAATGSAGSGASTTETPLAVDPAQEIKQVTESPGSTGLPTITAASFLNMLWDPTASGCAKQRDSSNSSNASKETPVTSNHDNTNTVDRDPTETNPSPLPTTEEEDLETKLLAMEQKLAASNASPPQAPTSKESLASKRERIERLKLQRKKRQQVLTKTSSTPPQHDPAVGLQSMPSEEEEEEEIPDGQNIEVAIRQVHKKKKKKMSKKKKKKSKSDKKKKRSSNKKKKAARKESNLTVTWKRIKAGLQPWKKKREVSLFSASSDSDGEDTSKREAIRRSMEQEAAATVVGRSTKLKDCKKKAKALRRKANRGKSASQYNGDADTEKEPKKTDLADTTSFDMALQRQSPESAAVSIAIAAASRTVSFQDDVTGSKKKDSDDIGRDTDEFDEENGSYYFTEKEIKAVVSQPSLDQSNYSASFYSTAGEESDNEETGSTAESHTDTSLVPQSSALVVDPYISSKKGDQADLTKIDFSWLHGKKVQMPCPTGECCGAWQHTEAAPDDQSNPATAGTSSSPMACLSGATEYVLDATTKNNCMTMQWGDKTDPFCNVPTDLYNDSVFSEQSCMPSKAEIYSDSAEIDNPEEVAVPTNSTLNGVYHSCGVVLQNQQDNMCSAKSTAVDDKEVSSFSLSEKFNQLEQSIADLQLHGPTSPCGPNETKKHKRPPKKGSDETSSSRSSRKNKKGKKAARRKPSPDYVASEEADDAPIEPGSTVVDSKSHAATKVDTAKIDSVLQAMEDDAFAMLSQVPTKDASNGIAEANEDAVIDDFGVAPLIASVQAIAHTKKVDTIVKKQKMVVPEPEPLDDGSVGESVASVSLASEDNSLENRSQASSVYTPENQESMDDIALGYSESNIDEWSVDAEFQESKKTPPRKPAHSSALKKTVAKEEAKAPGPLQVATQPISDFMMGLFGVTPEKENDSKQPGGVPASIQSSLSDKMEKPNSLRSLNSVGSSDGTGSDGSMSSLSCSMHGARGKSGPASSLDRHRLERLVSELMNHKNGVIFVSCHAPFPNRITSKSHMPSLFLS